MRQNKVQVNSLTSLRGIAALVVLWAHTSGYYVRPEWLDFLIAYTPIKLLLDSGVAVNLFFVLSGFVLSINFFGKNISNQNYEIETFFLSRIIRICFPYWLILALSWLAYHYLFLPIETTPASQAYKLWQPTVDSKQFLLDALMFKANNAFFFIPQAWTLAIELKISLLMPLFIFIARRGLFALWVFTLSLVLIFKLPHYVFNFCFGVMLAYYYEELVITVAKLSLISKLLIVIVSSYICSIPALLKLNYHEYIYLGVFTHAVGSSGLLIAALSFKRILETPLLMRLGTISYSLYLTHMLVIWLITPRFVFMLNSFEINNGLIKLYLFIFTTIVSLLVANITYIFIEAPSLRLGRLLLNICSSIMSAKYISKKFQNT